MIKKRALRILGWMMSLAVVCGAAAETNAPVAPAQQTGLPAPSGIPWRPAQPVRLPRLGDPAPALSVLEWVKGQPVKIQPGTNFYVVVFCTLTRANDVALTNLSSLQKRYQDKGLITVAISDDPPALLKEFVQNRGGEINFTVAADDYARKTTTDYQQAFWQMMLPRAYVVGKEGTVLWYGHPLRDDLGLVVDAIASGKYNMTATQKEVRSREQLEEYLFRAREDSPVAPKLGQMLLHFRTNDAAGLLEMASEIAKDPGLVKRDVALATTALDRSAQLTTTNATDIAVTRAILVFQSGQEQAGLAKAREVLAQAKTPAERDSVQAYVKVMEARMASEKSGGTNSARGQP